MKYCYFKTRNRRGFTLVELMVVLAVTAILAVLAGGGLLAYTRLARFQKNESNARAMFQTAQLAAAQMELAGEKDDFTAQVAAEGNGGHITEPLTDTMTQEECDALNARVCALYFDKGAEPTPDTPEGKLYAYIKDYVYDSSFLDAAFCIEIDASTGQVFSVFYDSGAKALRFENNKGDTDATLLDDRSYQNRRDQTLVGYYCADDAVNVVNLQQSKLRVRNQRLINGETLDVTWGGTSKSNETDTQYTVEIYSKTDNKKLFSVLVTLPAVNDPPKSLPVTLYKDGIETTENYAFPLRYANGSFVLTLDAMNDAAILQAHSKDANVAKTEFFSITRFVKDATNIYAKITAAPRAESVTSYTVSEGAITNTENSLYANASAELQCFRHLYNLRWYAKNTDLTATLTKDIDWLSGAPVVYCADGNKTAAKTPAADAPVAWPSLLELKKNVTLNGNRHTITGLQLRGDSVAKKDGCRYIGLVAENSGTIQDLTLADPDVLVNLTAEPAATGTTYTVGGETLAVMDTEAKGYRENVRAVGALCGVSTGTVENCTVKRSKNRMATARVAASLTFNDTTTAYTRVKNADGKTIDNEPLGIGGLVGSAVPGSGKTLKDLTVEKNVTVAGIWQDNGTKATAAAASEATERDRIKTNGIDRAIGVGGVFGVLSLQEEPCTVEALYNAAEVCGNAYTGGVAGNLRGKSASETTANNLNNTGSVLALAGYNGYTAGESRVLGQFFGGVAGMMKNAALTKSYSSTRSSLSENDVKTLIANGYGNGGTLSAASPLQGDFVGGLVGFGDGVTITNCKTGSGYVLGNTFVGGVVGGLSTGTVLNDGAANNSHVFGHRYVGGVVSFNGAGGSITGMSNTGMTAAFGANAAYAGGIVGYNAGTLTDCTAAASTNTATNASRVQLLHDMAKGYYADFVGGVAGYNADTITWTKDAAVSTLLNGGSFVGGVVGFNDENAQIIVQNSAALTVSGRITGAQDAVGGLVGLNSGTTLPAVTLKAELISGRYCVGGVLGANVVTKNMTADKLCTGGSGNSLQAQALAGGIVGYNQVIQTMPTADNTITRAKRLLPEVTADTNNILTVSEQNNKGTATVTLNKCTNALNLTADAYVGGVVGCGENLELNNAVNGAQNSVSMGVLRSSGSLQVTCQAVTGNAAGGIIGYAGVSTKLNGCQNYAGVFHKQMAGGIAGYNAGTIENCTQNANLGTRQAGYNYIGGIAGVNAGTIQAGKPNNVTISGDRCVGGVAGLNAKDSTIENITNCTVTVQGSEAVGGVAGENNGTVQNSTLQNVTVAASGSNAGGAVGQNSGTVQSVTVQGGSVQGNEAAGGLAGENLGSVQDCTTEAALNVRADQNAGAAVGSNAQNAVVAAGSYAGTVYAASGYAGGMAGQNAGSVQGTATVSAKVTCENGNAGGVTAVNSGTIGAVQVDGCTVNSGSANMGAVAAVNNGTIQGVTVKSAALQGGATVIGGIAGVNKGTIIGTDESACKVEQNALTLSDLTAADITLGGAAGQNEKDAIINNVQVALNVTQKLEKYRTLGGVAGENNGTLQNCVFTAGQLGETITNDAPAKVGAAEVGDAIGGVAGVNNATVTGCTVQKIHINMLGITNVESSQNVATKLDNASHVGGIVGRNSNKGTIQDSFIGTEESSAVIAKYGFVGGIAGSNAGEISGCGGQGTKDAVNQIKIWLGGGETGIDEMITQLQYGITKNNAGEVTSQDTAFNDLRGVDAVRDGTGGYAAVYTTGLAENQLTVALRGSATKRTEEAAGYLGGVTGYNTDTGVISETATGKWFVYCDNGNVDNAVIGGMIGQNESDKDMTNLLNCAAVRRFNRTKDNTEGNDDAQNSNNQHVENAGVGGVIGVQQNRSGDRWSLTNVVNYGTVHNSRSNRMAGVICLWLDNGGTLEHCFNFGTLYANSNSRSSQGASGTAGGIVAVFDKPVSGGTTNLVSCQNHGYIWSENRQTANDVGGILGMVRMKNPNDYLIINISDCVVGDIGMRASSQAAGMIAWLASPGTNQKLSNVYVNIDRCRNYCTWIETYGGSNRKIGIAGNRDGDDTTGATTISACFVLYSADSDNYAIACNTNSQNVQTYAQNHALLPNFYMDKYSFASDAGNDRVRGLEGLAENALGSTSQQDTTNNDYPACTDSSKIYGYRLYAGSNITDNNYFAAQIPAENPALMTDSTAYLREIYPENSKIDTATNAIVDKDGNQKGKLMFTFTEKGDNSSPSKKDINDAAVRQYYATVLDKRYDMTNAEVTNIKAVRSDDTSGGTSIYGRYRVTWNPVTGASHYKVTVMVQGEDGTYKEMPDVLPTATVYTNQYTFEAPKEWLGKQYIVEITPCNSQEGKATSSSTETPFVFAKTLPTPQIKLLSFDNGVDVILENVDDYKDVTEGWTLSVDCGGIQKDFTQDKVSGNGDNGQKGTKGYLFWLYSSTYWPNKSGTVSVRATVKANNPTKWMQSAQYNVMTYLPGDNYGGLGELTIANVAATGTSTDNLAITADVKITGQTVNPKYRIMLQGICQQNITTVDGKDLQGQYVTLQAVETVLSGSATHVTFSDLPDAALTDFTNLRILAAPVNTGMGDAICRWKFRVPQAPYTKGDSDVETNPVEYVREVAEDGKVSYVRYAFGSLWCLVQTNKTYPCTKTAPVTLNVLPAPTLSKDATPTLDSQNNLLYTFTWDNVPDAERYTYKLYGKTENGEVEINLPAGAAKLEPDSGQTKLTVTVDKLTNGAADWHFATVRLAVTSVPKTGSTNTVGATASKDYENICTRLTEPGAPNSILLTNNADAETLPYEITWTGIPDSALDHYELLAEYKDENGNWQPADPWTGTKDAHLIVNMEKYQGKTLHLRVVAVPAADNSAVRQSPYSETSIEFTVVKRETAPTVIEVKFTNPTPKQDEFLTQLQVQFAVDSGSSHYVTGYLFKEKTDYDAVVTLVNAWNIAKPDNKAAALKALQEKLAALLTNETETKAVCLIPEGSRTIGLPAETTDTAETTDKTVQYTLSPEKFAMQPQYGGWYLLPAVRTMTTEQDKASSVWTYYTPAAGLQVPCIQLDTPVAVRSTSLYTGNAVISDTPGAASGSADAQVEVQRVAVQWSADNLYTAADTMLANVYEVTVTPTTGNGSPYTLRITVQPKDEYETDESGNSVITTARGTVLSVEKIVEGTSDSELEAGADGSWVLDTTPTTLTGAILQDNSLRYYTMQVQPMLQYIADTKTYSLILPDLAAVVYEDPGNTTGNQLTPYTATVQITAKGENGFAAVQPSEAAVINPQQTN